MGVEKKEMKQEKMPMFWRIECVCVNVQCEKNGVL